uniref:Uncharacterized protein n=1 Tax=Echinococcus granulosus TaxID=6210 RepID=A0A068WF74_ECHGR|nr:hypothetical protein EgrG_000870800 [Echinococcus granulosus]
MLVRLTHLVHEGTVKSDKTIKFAIVHLIQVSTREENGYLAYQTEKLSVTQNVLLNALNFPTINICSTVLS